MEMNSFGDLTYEEFAATYTGLVVPPVDTNVSVPSPLSEDPDPVGGASLDWRNKKAVNPIQSQGGCGSCWAFTAISSVEGAWAIKKGSLIKLSEQQLVDCSKAGGCGGGSTNAAFNYMIKSGISSSSKYPYVGRDQSCKSTEVAARISKFTLIPAGNEGAMMAGVNLGPISISVAASKPFQFYSKGVFDDSSCGSNLNHGVTIVGYGTQTKDYWIVRNSWGNWGESGYIRIVRNKNMCGLARYPLYPSV